MAITTLGHSTHEPGQFIRIMDTAHITGIIDIRSHPTSKWPWWHRDATANWLAAAGKTYDWWPELGGWDLRHADLADWARPRGADLDPYLRGHFPKQRIGAKKPADQPTLDGNPDWVSGWTSQGLHDYAWYTATAEFRGGLDRLIGTYGENTQPRIAIICAELLWWKCHRSMVADAVIDAGWPIYHWVPTPDGKVNGERHAAKPRLGRYPAEVLSVWRGQRPAVQLAITGSE